MAGRTLPVSRTGKTWQRVADGRALGLVEIIDGTFDLWVDDRYAHDPPGAAYYDCVRFLPVPGRPDRPPVQGYARSRIDEPLERGLVARPMGESQVYLGWRLLKSDPATVGFNVYRRTADGATVRLNSVPLEKTTDVVDAAAPRGTACRYAVRPVVAGAEGGPRDLGRKIYRGAVLVRRSKVFDLLGGGSESVGGNPVLLPDFVYG